MTTESEINYLEETLENIRRSSDNIDNIDLEDHIKTLTQIAQACVKRIKEKECY